MNNAKIEEIIEKYKLPAFRAKQLRKSFFEEYSNSFENVTTLKKDLREELVQNESILTVKLYKMFKSADGRCFKAVMELHDGRYVETVLMSPKPGHWTTCISSQVGCALACTFCATGTMGLLRNLTSEEITDQVLFWKQFIKEQKYDFTLSNVVYMGMGEPLHNKKEVFASLRELTNPETFNMGSRHLSVSTSGMVKAVYELAEEFPQVNLALSLHAANDDLRTKLMPINKRWNLESLTEALNDYLAKTKRKIFIEYILLDGENDSIKHAEELATYLKTVQPSYLLHTNLIVYNKTASEHEQSTKDNARAFKAHLEKRGISATIRKNLGRDIDGACGQLVVQGQK